MKLWLIVLKSININQRLTSYLYKYKYWKHNNVGCNYSHTHYLQVFQVFDKHYSIIVKQFSATKTQRLNLPEFYNGDHYEN